MVVLKRRFGRLHYIIEFLMNKVLNCAIAEEDRPLTIRFSEEISESDH